MIPELIAIISTILGLALLQETSVLLTVLALAVLTYLFTAKYIAIHENSSPDSDFGNVSILDRYFGSIGSFIYRFLVTTPWGHLFKSAKQIVRILRGLEPNEDVRNGTTLPGNAEAVQHCGTEVSFENEITTIVNCVLREYMNNWYHDKISKDKDFINDVDCLIHNTLTAFCSGVTNVNKNQLLGCLLQIYRHYLHHFKEAVKNVGSTGGTVETCLEKKEELLQNFKLQHWALKDRLCEWSYLQSVMKTLIESYGPAELSSCPLLHTIIIEILAQNIMHPLTNILTDSHRLNSWIAKLLCIVLKLEDITLFHENTTDEGRPTGTAPSASIAEESSASEVPKTSAASAVFEVVEEVDSSKSHSNCNISDVDHISDTNPPINDIPSTAANESFEHDKSVVSKSQTLPEIFNQATDAEQGESSGSSLPMNSLMKVRAYSNVSVPNTCTDLDEEDFTVFPLTEAAAAMKRSKSADFISRMANMDTLLPLNSKNCNVTYCVKTKKSFVNLKSGATPSDGIDVAEEAVELPPLISDVKITGTVQQDVGHNAYTLYQIQYNGLFQKVSSQSQYSDLVQQQINIKRRFREFMALQSRLENNPSVKTHLKGIKGLSKWLATPFTSLDKRNVSERKVFLESYLQSLCKQDAIVQSPELQEFLAYGGDASIAFVKKPLDIHLPRIDKLIARSVRSAIDLFRTALPSTSDGITKETLLKQLSARPPYEDENYKAFCVEYTKQSSDILKRMENFLKNVDATHSTENISDCFSSDASNDSFRQVSLLQSSLSISDQAGCNCDDTLSTFDSLQGDNLLTHLILDIVVEIFPEGTVISDLLKFVPISYIQSIIETKLPDINEEKFAPLLHSLHKAVWPEIKSAQRTGSNISSSIGDSTLAVMLPKMIWEYLRMLTSNKYIEMLIECILGEKEVSEAVELLVGSIQIQEMNKCLLFYVLDAIIQVICPETEQ